MQVNKLLFFIILLPNTIVGQFFYRIAADFSIKEKSASEKSMLTIGKVYYDKNVKKVIYDVSFPDKQVSIISDSSIYIIKNDTLIHQNDLPFFTKYTIFDLCLNNKLNSFGLEDSPYQITNIEKDDSLIVVTWEPEADDLKKHLGKILISQKNKLLYGVVIFNKEGTILSKHFFNKYENIRGLNFPAEILQITYVNGLENYQMTTYENIVIDDYTNDEKYYYQLPASMQ